jgi:hypothetical protein
MPLMAERSKLQFRMRDLLWCVTLIGLALGLGIAPWRYGGMRADGALAFIVLFCWLGCPTALGAGIGILFGKPRIGAEFGLLIGMLSFGMLALLPAVQS